MFSIQRQQGVVLFFSLIILVIMTIIGVALAVNSTQSLRMAGAGSERLEAMISAQGAQDKIIDAKEGSDLGNMAGVFVEHDNQLDIINTITPLENYTCVRTETVTEGIGCKFLEISSAARFGRNNLGQVTIVAGVEQEIFTGN
ncbi:pilus assembly PilX family protein [Shewanella sp. HL-SH8]|uniref:pilus assembly PilX family protein n=1 Tax=Shewanella sp. HL-SH8 TaxID=3436242 RepID=UPI003EB7BE2F